MYRVQEQELVSYEYEAAQIVPKWEGMLNTLLCPEEERKNDLSTED